MLRRWLSTETSPSALGACSTIGVSASRSTDGQVRIAVNIDDRLVSTFRESAETFSTQQWLASAHFFVGRNSEGIAAVVVVRRSARRLSAAQLGGRLLDQCKHLDQVGDALSDHRFAHVAVFAADATTTRAWRMNNASVTSLEPTAGLLTLSAGHSSADPLPAGGWMIDRLERLHLRPRISLIDLRKALQDVELGESTSCSMVVNASTGDVSIERVHTRVVAPVIALRKSA